ncbi:ABC transporter ATP-binding protein [Desertivirga arenae]|uniref:ABC transporter ATP-binding protein n=1 Tax=Desertivirga arenae TaxID=2810309 RepID=UPI001A975F94|nr:ABC transporter ATP-binding protein [Pedobacter sp. SYSU D00823]
MSKIAIKAENLSKAYQLGEFSTGTISRDIERWWAKLRGKEDPFLKIGETNDRTSKGTSDIVWSLKDLDFEINQGDAIGVIGRNGAGKSTLLKVLSRVTTPTTGSVKVKGRIASLLEVGTGFHPELTGRENIYLNGAILGMRKAEISRHFDAIVDFAGVDRYVDTPVKRYSSGMYVRLAFAVAAHLESEILIVDEVLAVGDAEFQSKCLGKMSEVSQGEGRTVLFVSHNMASIKALCQKGILLKNGGLAFQGDVNDAIEKYVSNTKVTSPEDIKRLKGNGEVQISNILINDSCETYANIFEDITITIPFEINNIGKRKLEFFVIIYDNEEQAVLSFFQKDSGAFTLIDETQRNGSVSFSLQNPLKPGSYKVSAGIFDEHRNFLDWIDSNTLLNVESNFHYGGPFDNRAGNIFIPVQWKI